MSESWMDQALCAQVGGDLWFPTLQNDTTNQAKAICAVCPVREICLQYSLDNNLDVGVYGGTGPAERRRLKRGAA